MTHVTRSLIIRPERPSDIAAIHALTKAAFLNAPHTGHTEHFIVDALRDAGALTISLVADEAGALVGHVAISPVTISDGTHGWFGLGPISVAPELQRSGIGTQLMHAALQKLRTDGANGCVVLGDPRYYSRFGFRPEPGLVLVGVRPENFQVLRFGTSHPSGVVTYHSGFNAHAD